MLGRRMIIIDSGGRLLNVRLSLSRTRRIDLSTEQKIFFNPKDRYAKCTFVWVLWVFSYGLTGLRLTRCIEDDSRYTLYVNLCSHFLLRFDMLRRTDFLALFWQMKKKRIASKWRRNKKKTRITRQISSLSFLSMNTG